MVEEDKFIALLDNEEDEELKLANVEQQRRTFSDRKLELKESLDLLTSLIVEKGLDTPYPSSTDQYGLLMVKPNYFEVRCNSDIEKMATASVRRMFINKRVKKNWTKEDIVIMVWVIDQGKKPANTFAAQDWEKIASYILGKDSEQTMFKWLSMWDAIPSKKNAQEWTDKENEIIIRLAQNVKGSPWQNISKQIYLQTKKFYSAKRCRQRWCCFLNPNNRKSIWSQSQDFVLLKEVQKVGKKWLTISKQLVGRTENAIKNRYALLIKKLTKTKKCMQSRSKKNTTSQQKTNRIESFQQQGVIKEQQISSMFSTVQLPNLFQSIDDEFPALEIRFGNQSIDMEIQTPRLLQSEHEMIQPLQAPHQNKRLTENLEASAIFEASKLRPLRRKHSPRRTVFNGTTACSISQPSVSVLSDYSFKIDFSFAPFLECSDSPGSSNQPTSPLSFLNKQ